MIRTPGYRIHLLMGFSPHKRHKNLRRGFTLPRGGICHCRHCQRQCKNFASGVNFSTFTHFLCYFLLKLLKLGEIDGVKFLAWKSGSVKFWTNSMSGAKTKWLRSSRQEEGFILLQSRQVSTDKIGRNILTQDYVPGRRDSDDIISTLVQNQYH